MEQNSRYRVFVTGSGIAAEANQLLKAGNCLVETGMPQDSPRELLEKIALFAPDALIVRQGKIGREILEVAANLKVICKHGVGTDNIDIDAATRAGIPVFFTPGAYVEAVATHAFALILALIRQIPDQDKRIRNGVFDKGTYRGQELLGRTLGIIGFGRVGRRVATMVTPFDMKVLAYHPSHTNEALPGHIHKVRRLDDVFRHSDIVSAHCPLTPETKHLLNKDAFALMKHDAFLINTARGGIVNEADLSTALEKKQIGGAALDVFETEPPSEDNPLFQRDNVIVTTHVASSSSNSLKNMGNQSAKHVLSVLKGEEVDKTAVKNPMVL